VFAAGIAAEVKVSQAARAIVSHLAKPLVEFSLKLRGDDSMTEAIEEYISQSFNVGRHVDSKAKWEKGKSARICESVDLEGRVVIQIPMQLSHVVGLEYSGWSVEQVQYVLSAQNVLFDTAWNNHNMHEE
jgi:hypothetical protein